MRKLKELWKFLKTYKFALLLVSLFLLIIVPVFIPTEGLRILISYLLLSFTLITSIVIFYRRHNPKLFFAVFTIVFIMIFVNWLNYFSKPGSMLGIGRALMLMGMFLMIFVNIFREFKRRGEVTLDFIFGAISGFLLLGIIGALLCFTIEFYYPGSFSFIEVATDFREFLYFSFVTITTLGYGDLLPASNQGEVVAILMAVVGQLYLTIIIALIIGRYLANSDRLKNERRF